MKLEYSKQMPNYQNGQIYALRSYQSDDVYIGSTTMPLSKRKCNHVSDYKKYKAGTRKGTITSFKLCELPDMYIELVEKYPCDNKQELERREGQIIRETECVNKRIAGRTAKEYRTENKEDIKVRHKTYRDANKDKIKKQNHDYYAENKEDVQKRQKKWLDKNVEKVKKYKSEWCAENAERLAKQHKDRYEENRDEELINRKKWYAQNKTTQLAKQAVKFTCDCGKTLTVGKKAQHARSQKHIKHLASLN
jgi:hypothetical protein